MTLYQRSQGWFYECPSCGHTIGFFASVVGSGPTIECTECSEYMEQTTKPANYQDPIDKSLEQLEEEEGDS